MQRLHISSLVRISYRSIILSRPQSTIKPTLEKQEPRVPSHYDKYINYTPPGMFLLIYTRYAAYRMHVHFHRKFLQNTFFLIKKNVPKVLF